MKFIPYFLNVFSCKHPEVKLEWIECIICSPVKQMTQVDGCIVYWGNISEMGGRALQVITLEDGETVHNAFFDLNFYRRQQRGEEPS